MNFLKELFTKYRSLISYAFFGVCTTLINWVSYILFYDVLHVENVPSTIIAWGFAVAFAFITNKIWVFNSKSFSAKTLLYETFTFIAARIATGLLDVLIMYISVDVLMWNAAIWKLISNVIVIVLNYFFSKLMIFKKNKTQESDSHKDTN